MTTARLSRPRQPDLADAPLGAVASRDDDMAGSSISLTNGMVALVDDADLPLVAGYTWKPTQSRPGAGIYARAWIDGSLVRMHRLILGTRQGQLIDHVNGDTLDNRRQNLRIVDHSGNAANRFARRSATGFKGVAVNRAGRYRAQIHVRGRDLYLGLFDSPEEAAAAYAAAAHRYFGAFANVDSPPAPAPRPERSDLAGPPLGATDSRDASAQTEAPCPAALPATGPDSDNRVGSEERLFCRCGIQVKVVRLGGPHGTGMGHTANPREKHHYPRLATSRRA